VSSTRFPPGSVAEALGAWVATLLGLLVISLLGHAVPYLGQLVGAAAVAAFLWVPSWLLERRGLDARDAGFRFDHLGSDLLWGLGACAVVLPLFTLGFLRFTELVPALPAALRGVIAPYVIARGPLHGLPHGWNARLDLLGRVAGNAAVALAEEFFYRGWLTMQLEAAWPPRFKLLGARLGRGALLANLLFAAGHLLVFAPWRLATFFPGLLFAWLRARTGRVGAGAVCHWLCNVWLMLLEVAAYG
jgi:uncharacterized protein